MTTMQSIEKETVRASTLNWYGFTAGGRMTPIERVHAERVQASTDPIALLRETLLNCHYTERDVPDGLKRRLRAAFRAVHRAIKLIEENYERV